MKLRNKKTGNVIEAKHILIFEYEDMYFEEELATIDDLGSIKDLNENWEDYKEPRIEDESVRKAVQVWAKVNGIKVVDYIILGDDISIFRYKELEINFAFQVKGVQDDKTYNITELCGEEE